MHNVHSLAHSDRYYHQTSQFPSVLRSFSIFEQIVLFFLLAVLQQIFSAKKFQ